MGARCDQRPIAMDVPSCCGGVADHGLANGRLYVGDYRGSMLSMDASRGSLIWRYATGAQILATPLVASGRVYIGSGDGYFYALDAHSGRPAWRYQTGEIRGSASLANG